ncbi:MAG: hypothetical protein QM504_08485 [Pseudomonadota bacterium]
MNSEKQIVANKLAAMLLSLDSGITGVLIRFPREIFNVKLFINAIGAYDECAYPFTDTRNKVAIEIAEIIGNAPVSFIGFFSIAVDRGGFENKGFYLFNFLDIIDDYNKLKKDEK